MKKYLQFGYNGIAQVCSHISNYQAKKIVTYWKSWIILKCHMVQLVKNVKDVKYLHILEKIFKNNAVKNGCRNELNIDYTI